jgi:hypothetical protein
MLKVEFFLLADCASNLLNDSNFSKGFKFNFARYISQFTPNSYTSLHKLKQAKSQKKKENRLSDVSRLILSEDKICILT